MQTIFRRTALVSLMGAALALGACASNSDVERAQQTADQAQQSAQQAQQTAQQALTAAQQANQKADQANAQAQANATPPPTHRGPRG